jgi:hypothetical protein
METSPLISEVMSFKEQVPVRSKIVTGNTVLKHIWDINLHTKRDKT